MAVEGQGLHITISVTPKEGVDLSHDLRLVKAATLYGDKAKLCSAMSSAMILIHRFGQMKTDRQIDLLTSTLPFFIKDQLELQTVLGYVALYKQMVSKKHKGGLEYRLENRMKKGIRELWERTVQRHSAFAQPEVVKGIERAISEGILELHIFEEFKGTPEIIKKMVNDTFSDHDTVQAVMSEYLGLVTEAVQDGETYPMFDDLTGRMLRAFVEAGDVTASPASVAQSKQSALAADLLRRLPLFDDASVPEIIDIRRELDRPLVRFRSAVMGYAEKIKSASWEDDFTVEAEQVF